MGHRTEFNLQDAMFIETYYLIDKDDVPCPECGRQLVTHSVVDTLTGIPLESVPQGAHTKILGCNFCGASTALNIDEVGVATRAGA